jgi:Zn-dependent protease
MAFAPIPLADDRTMLRAIAEQVLTIRVVEELNINGQEGLRFRGQLMVSADNAYAYLAPRFHDVGYTALLQNDEQSSGVSLLAAPGRIMAPPHSRLWLALLMFAITVASTVFVGGFSEAGWSLGLGLAYSAALLGILLAHELGHYLVARRLGVAVSYPFFIPLPLPPLGTMGAFIQMKEPILNRRNLLAIGIAGPLAGLVVAIPVLILGLLLSEVRPMAGLAGQPVLMEGNSLLYAGLKILIFGRFLPDGIEDVYLHPVAFAGWAGLLVTGLNLIPAGQLDGGHILYALFGPRIARFATYAIAVLLLAMGFLWSGWFLWAILITLLGRQRAPLLNEVTPLDNRFRLLAIIGLIIFVLVFTPTPLTLIMPQ